jgi:DNA topoisomerase-1
MQKKNLIVVESPTKATTLSKFLGGSYQVIASYGHVRDLPKSKLGIDVESDFKLQYLVPKDKREHTKEIINASGKAKEIFLATDPDREGESISWHIAQLVEEKSKVPIKRVTFHEITEKAVKDALDHPGMINLRLVDAQQARRALDRLVGYKLSPLLWNKVRKGLSAGRVQSVALRLIVDRERERDAFQPEEYWSVEALLRKQPKGEEGIFKAELVKYKNENIKLSGQEKALKVVGDLKNASYEVSRVGKREVKKSPYPPFTTSTLQQAAANKLKFTSKKTMKVAQDLYERGLISYHRTDSLNLSELAIGQIREYITEKFGKEFLPVGPRRYKTKSKVAQEAHEAIRPTYIHSEPSSLQNELSKDHVKLYHLIWQNALACQMADAIYDQTSVDIKAKDYIFRANGSVLKFSGWALILERKEEGSKEKEPQKLPELKVGEQLDLINLLPEQHFTEPPPRFTEAGLIKALEERGVGRPSTYAPILSTIVERNYVERLDGKFQPTSLGVGVNDFLVNNFSNIVNAEFTARMEDQLDAIANGEKPWVPVIKEFYEPFSEQLEKVYESSQRVEIPVEETEEICDICKRPMVIKYGRFGKFLACSGYPDCKNTKNYEKKADALCPNCGGDVVIKRTRRGRNFFGCSNYPGCNWMSWKKPEIITKSNSEEKSEEEGLNNG